MKHPAEFNQLQTRSNQICSASPRGGVVILQFVILTLETEISLENKGGSRGRAWVEVEVLAVMIGVVNLPCSDQRHANSIIFNVWYVCGLYKLRNYTCESAALKHLIVLLQN